MHLSTNKQTIVFINLLISKKSSLGIM